MNAKILIAMSIFTIVAATKVCPAMAQDPVKVDPAHYRVVFENERVRVLKVHYGSGEKSVMHEHPDSVVVFLSDQKARFTSPDGKSQVREGKAGEAQWTAATKHLPENVSETPLDLVLVELKTKGAASK